MGRARFSIPDYPADRPSAASLAARIGDYYRMPGRSAGGDCHVVLDDYNLDAGSVRSCLDQCEAAGDEVGAGIMRDMLGMSRTQRRKATKMADTSSGPAPRIALFGVAWS